MVIITIHIHIHSAIFSSCNRGVSPAYQGIECVAFRADRGLSELLYCCMARRKVSESAEMRGERSGHWKEG